MARSIAKTIFSTSFKFTIACPPPTMRVLSYTGYAYPHSLSVVQLSSSWESSMVLIPISVERYLEKCLRLSDWGYSGKSSLCTGLDYLIQICGIHSSQLQFIKNRKSLEEGLVCVSEIHKRVNQSEQLGVR